MYMNRFTDTYKRTLHFVQMMWDYHGIYREKKHTCFHEIIIIVFFKPVVVVMIVLSHMLSCQKHGLVLQCTYLVEFEIVLEYINPFPHSDTF